MATAKAQSKNGPQPEVEEVFDAETTLEIPELRILKLNLHIKGDSPLIMHAWSQKAKEEMLAKQMGKARAAKAPKDPHQDYLDAFYRLDDGRPGFPSVAFKSAAVSAATQLKDKSLPKTLLRGAFHIPGELVPIEGEARMRQDQVRIAMGTSDIRFRPEFPNWTATLPIRLNIRALTIEQLAHLFSVAGFAVGVGEWRPERDGAFGMFSVVSLDQVGYE